MRKNNNKMLEIVLYWAVCLDKESSHCLAFNSFIIYIFFRLQVNFFFFEFFHEKLQYIIKLLKLWTKI